MLDSVAVTAVVHGRVQGVWFRASTRDVARDHGVTGWVRNEPDGTVRAHLEGMASSVEAVVAWIRSGGPPGAHVDRLDVTPDEVEGHDRFAVL